MLYCRIKRVKEAGERFVRAERVIAKERFHKFAQYSSKKTYKPIHRSQFTVHSSPFISAYFFQNQPSFLQRDVDRLHLAVAVFRIHRTVPMGAIRAWSAVRRAVRHGWVIAEPGCAYHCDGAVDGAGIFGQPDFHQLSALQRNKPFSRPILCVVLLRNTRFPLSLASAHRKYFLLDCPLSDI